jgi:integrase/recombinase XerD
MSPSTNESPSHPDHRPKWIAEGELTCSGPGCSKPIPAGFYGRRKTIYYCSQKCRTQGDLRYRALLRCEQCKKQFRRVNYRCAHTFCGMKCFSAWRIEQSDKKKIGRFKPIYDEYMLHVAPRYWAKATVIGARYDLSGFFAFLNNRKIRSLERVTPKLVDEFIRGRHPRWVKSPWAEVSTLRAFFDWMIADGRRKSPNPVHAKLHGKRREFVLPNPFTREELTRMWKILDEAGDDVLKVAVALGQEAGLRIGEAANVRLEDVNLERMEVFVRLPNKTMLEHFCPFHFKTRDVITEWLKKRGERDHDHLLINERGGPMNRQILRRRINRVLCGPGKFPRFRFHRLRSTAASVLARGGADTSSIMDCIGWRSPAVARLYVRLYSDDVRNKYRAAMEKAEQLAETRPVTATMDEFFAKQPGEADKAS